MKKNELLRLAALVVLLLSFLGLELTKAVIPAPDSAQKRAASEKSLYGSAKTINLSFQ